MPVELRCTAVGRRYMTLRTLEIFVRFYSLICCEGFLRRAFLDDGRRLGLKVASEYPQRVPKATQFIAEM